ncbi:MAG: chitobiase/beta-hexosaminidase C-terminal domain-containing protein [Lachnospiraceae bacterium]|nr:chitobiase/beta-hexosaminidase C-terminal domain-containing protein [Lachnospiraceae bacterium]
MICPDCGRDVPEGLMYCDVCGREFHMVPEFEPEIENQIDKTLSRLARKIGTEDAPQEKQPQGKEPRPAKRAKSETREKRTLIAVLIACAAAVLVAVVVALVHKSADDYVRMAQSAVEAGDDARAVSYLENALEKQPQDATVILMLSEALVRTGDTGRAYELLDRIINSAVYTPEENKSAFEIALATALDTGDFGMIQDLLSRCPYEDLRMRYLAYVPGDLMADPAEGSYQAPFSITLTSSDDEVIYYTINGGVPDTTSTPYRGPIEITEQGSYHLQAVCVNPQGAVSGIFEARYEAEKPAVPAPQVLEDSGSYTAETKIVVVCGEGLRILYETGEDAKVTANSEEYTEPISMPEGESVFHFACIDEEGELSETVTREYELTLEHTVTSAEAVERVMAELMRTGVVQDMSGRVAGEEAYLSFEVDGTVTIGADGNFYYIREYRTVPGGQPELTGLLYAVHTQSGLTRRLGYDSRGQMMLMQFN